MKLAKSFLASSDYRDIRTELKEMRKELTEIKVLLYKVLEIPHKEDKG